MKKYTDAEKLQIIINYCDLAVKDYTPDIYVTSHDIRSELEYIKQCAIDGGERKKGINMWGQCQHCETALETEPYNKVFDDDGNLLDLCDDCRIKVPKEE